MIELNHIGAAAFLVRREADDSFVFERINTAAERMTGLSNDTTVGRPLTALFPAEVAAMLASHYAECMDRRTTVEFERTFAVPLGEIATRTTLSPIFSAPDAPVRRLLGVSVDITEHYRLEKTLKSSSARLEIAMAALGGAHWFFDARRQQFELSSAFDNILGSKIPQRMGLEEWLTHVHPEDREDTCFADILAGRKEQGTAEFRVMSGNGDVRWLRCRRRAVAEGQSIAGIAGVVLDVTQEKRREAALSLQAASDPLTGLPNRRRFEEVLTAAKAQAAAQRRGGLALLMVDVGQFKAYNDGYGHVAGDAVLKRIAKCLTATVAKAGGTVARYGGEEFVAVLPGLSTNEAAAVADTILAAIRALHEPHMSAPEGIVSVSIGVAGHPRMTEKTDLDLIGLADAALYRAKSDGRDCYRVMAAPHLRPVQAGASAA